MPFFDLMEATQRAPVEVLESVEVSRRLESILEQPEWSEEWVGLAQNEELVGLE